MAIKYEELGRVDHSQGRHLFVTKGISADAQVDHAIQLVSKDGLSEVYVHHHQFLAMCVEQCKRYTPEHLEGELVIEPNKLTKE